MGSVVSRAKLIIGAVVLLNNALDKLSKRLKTSPGLPVTTPTTPFWSIPKTPIPGGDKELPLYADVVVIGSGITGTSFAYHALKRNGSLRIVMLEAREACSGATGGNGGHINPPLYDDWQHNKKDYGEQEAKKLVKFRLAHAHEMQKVAKAEDILDISQVRLTEHIEVYMDPEAFQDAKDKLKGWKDEMPDEAGDFSAYDGIESSERFLLADCTKGCVVGPGGAMHPYRFVTSLLVKLLNRHGENFSLATHTPCTAVEPPTPSHPLYTVATSKGTISTPHVVHATNGWVSHLLAPMREKVVPVRGTMSAQRPGTSLSPSTLDGLRSFVFHPGGLGYDYLTQLPTGEHELMFGGGWASAFDSALTDVGLADDSAFSINVASHLAGALPLFFGSERWGREKLPDHESNSSEDEGSPATGEHLGDVRWAEGRTKAQWGGILGISADGLPWVGRLPAKVSGRPAPARARSISDTAFCEKEKQRVSSDFGVGSNTRLAAPGEWISAGYTGEGMVHAWLCGKALAYMVEDADDEIRDWFPEMLRVTEERWKKAKLEDFIARRL